MSQDYHSGSSGARTTTSSDHDDYMVDNRNGVESALTHYWGPSDPSAGASPAWGAAELGTIWIDTTDPQNPVAKMWCRLDATPTYGWRTMRVPKIKWLTATALASRAITFSPASPATGDVAFTAVDLTTLLDTLQDSTQVTHLVVAVLLRIRVRTGASETVPTTDDAYFGVRPTGAGASSQNNVYAQVANRYFEAQVWVPLDANESFDFKVEVGGGTAGFEYAAWIDAIAELAL